MSWDLDRMAREVVALLTPGCTVNLGIGMPTSVAERIPPELDVMIHSENGVLGIQGRPTRETVSATLINAGKETVSIRPGASYFDSGLSFGMIRGGHVDVCVLGGMQVDVAGNLANWMVPGEKVTGMGGAMDLVHGARRVVVMLRHHTKDGRPKLLEACTLPLTGMAVVHTVVTDLGVFEPTGRAFRVVKLAEGVEPEGLGLLESAVELGDGAGAS